MERWVGKVLALGGSFVLPFVCTLLPYKVHGCVSQRGDGGKRILSLLMCFGGGIFFGTFLLHMGPDMRSLVRQALMEKYHIEYPLGDLFVGAGFFLVLFAEKLVLRVHAGRLERRRRAKLADRCVNVTSTNGGGGGGRLYEPCAAGKSCSGLRQIYDNELSSDGGTDPQLTKMTTKTTAADDGANDSKDATVFTLSPYPGTTDGPTEGGKNKLADQCDHKETGEAGVARDNADNAASEHSHHNTRSIILVLALSLHRIFEGMSIGLQGSSQAVGSLFLAVMCHETVIGFSLGLQFVKARFPFRRLLVMSLVCSVIMPVGVMIGILMTEVGRDATTVMAANGVLQGIAMGTFIYVTFFEILHEELESADTSFAKILCVAGGFVMMALLNIIPEGQGTPPVAGNASLAMMSANDTMIAHIETL